MAGSSLPYAEYEPRVELPRGRELDHLVAIGYGGLESYGFHALEAVRHRGVCGRFRPLYCGVVGERLVEG